MKYDEKKIERVHFDDVETNYLKICLITQWKTENNHLPAETQEKVVDQWVAGSVDLLFGNLFEMTVKEGSDENLS